MSRSFVTFASHEIGASASALMNGPATLTQNQPAGWQQVNRNSRQSLTIYQAGGAGWQLDQAIVFDGWISRVSQESHIHQLERMADFLDSEERTPICTIDANGAIPKDYTRAPHMRWVISAIVWGDYLLNQNNKRLRQEATVTLWEYIPDVVEVAKNVAPGTKIPNTYKIQSGDTLQKIAARFYGDQTEWHAIAKTNKLRDPNHPPVGKTIKLPKVTVK